MAGVLAVDGRAYEVTATPGPLPEGSRGLGPPKAEAGATGGLILALGGAFLGGLILNLMPCVFPILSMKAAALAGHAGEAGRARAQALAFLGGVLGELPWRWRSRCRRRGRRGPPWGGDSSCSRRR